ncbi:MAG: serpin family protein [Planctomycetes bacterium]|nr:serpin family protein [Planctomycetota bacterium]
MIHLALPLILSIQPEQPSKPGPEDLAFAAAQAQVALDVYKLLDDAPGNVVFSPFSLSRALSMTREGARGETASEIDAALRLSPESGARFAALARLLEPRSAGRKGDQHPVYTLELATSLWGQRGVPFQTDFVARLKAHYASEIFPTEFQKPEEARSLINAWASAQTKERISEILPAGILTSDTRLVLVDTVYFIAAWQDPFREANTKLEPFTTSKGVAVEASTMHRVGNLAYAETERAQVLELPYEMGAAGLVIVLPKPGQTLDAVIEHEDVAAWTAQPALKRVDVALPKFRFRFARQLNQTLQSLGVKQAFQLSRADFTGIMPVPLAIGAVLQECFVAVDEKGTEAAAATAVVMLRAAAETRPEEPIVFRADHPFLFFVRHKSSGTVLFMGRVEDPTR